MSEKPGKNNGSQDIEDVAEQAERGEDISEHFTGEHTVKQRINIDFPLNLLEAIDMECKRVGVTRHAWIKMACAEMLRQAQV